ncbi:uncharacterized protein LOC134251958 isoform X2 [Saccostrea cucullata]|uniref:uncharacterized protein LOC134251958 isoform X2 n=1 Tax=Saccostrea cuccullata TaxID=36930 RepID=UPI002ED6BDBA
MLPKKRMKLRSQPAQAPLVESALGNAVDASSSATQASCTNNPPIDYDQLAAAILRQQQALTPSSASSNNIVSQATPSTSQAVPSASSTSSSDPSSLNLVNTLQQLFSGSGESVADTLNGNSTHSTPLSVDNGIPLGANVPVRIKNKIWNDQFIDLKCLLPNYKDQNISIQIENNAIQLNPQSTKQSVMSLHQWTSAFLIFMSIYTEKSPQEHANLLKYCFTVREIGSSNGDGAWRYYDENFRKLRQSNKIPWQLPITEYMVKACTLTRSFRSSQYLFNQSKTKQWELACFSYNNGKPCKTSPCKYMHICQHCGEQHPKKKCNKWVRNNPIRKPNNTNNNKT